MSDAEKTVPNWDASTKVKVEKDVIHHPDHYTDGGIETIDFIRAKLSSEAFEGYCIGNVLKYLSRYGKKSSRVEDLEKAEVYLKWAIKEAKDQ